MTTIGIDPHKATHTTDAIDDSENGLGYLLAQQLVAGGETMFDVPPMLASRIRVVGSGRSQKSVPNDARSVAIAAISQLRRHTEGRAY